MSGHAKRFLMYLGVFILLWLTLAWLGTQYPALDPDVLLSKARAERAKTYILDFGRAAPALFIMLQVLQVVIAPIPGQAAAFVGGFVFGWKLGTVYTMIGLTLGSWLAIALARKYGRRLIELINGKEAVAEFEKLLNLSESRSAVLQKTKATLRRNQTLTFFIIMVLPGLPDDLVCFLMGLTDVPVWRLVVLAGIGRIPANIGLNLLGDGFSRTESNWLFWTLMFLSFVLAAVYLANKDRVESWLKRIATRARAA
jgi:uncharacterized membrane protein YdjX (TVP38/TMEM64 family)